MCRKPRHWHGYWCRRRCSSTGGHIRESARGGRGTRATAGIVIVSLVSLLAPIASAQQAEPPEPLTGDPAIDAWVRTTFGQPVDPDKLDDPIWGTRTLLALTAGQREGPACSCSAATSATARP